MNTSSRSIAVFLCLLLSGCFLNKPIPIATPERGMVVFMLRGDHVTHFGQAVYPVVVATDFEGKVDWPREAANRGMRYDAAKNRLVGDEKISASPYCFYPSQVCISVNHLPGGYTVQRLVNNMGSVTTFYELDPSDRHFRFLLPTSRVTFIGSFRWSETPGESSFLGKGKDPTFSTSVWEGGPDEQAVLQILRAEPMFIRGYPAWRPLVEARLRELAQAKAAPALQPAATATSKPAAVIAPKKKPPQKSQ